MNMKDTKFLLCNSWVFFKAIPDQALLLEDIEQADSHKARLFTSVISVKHNSLEYYGREVPTLSINTSPLVSEGLRTNEDQDEAEDHGNFDEELYGDFDLVDFIHTKKEDKDLLYSEEFQTETLCLGTTVTVFFLSSFMFSPKSTLNLVKDFFKSRPDWLMRILVTQKQSVEIF